jgi:NAD(P)H-flavin reductase
METVPEENLLKIVIELKGVKTKNINLLEENDNMAIKGPYWNGVLGLKNINKCKDGLSLLIAGGIGMAPMIPVMRKLYASGNKIVVLIDKSNYKDIYIKEYLKMCNAEILECNLLSNGNLSSESKDIIKQYQDKVNLIYCSVTDILISKILEFADDNVSFACCNNAKMCCGEGVCGACSTRYAGHIVKKLCKVQIDPRYIFEGRRLL